MYRSNLALAAAIAAFTFTSAAYAADSDNATTNDSKSLTPSSDWYVSGSAGLSFLEHQSNRSGTINFDTTGANPGFAVTGALGKELGNGFRAEGELGYRRINMDHATVYAPGGTGIASGQAGGDASALSVMGNGYYDFKSDGPWVPYIGAGLGFAQVSMSDVRVGGTSVVDDDDLAFAYQAMAGVGYKVSPNGTIFTGYRYFAVDDPTFTDSANQHFRSEFASHNIELGYRLSF